MAVCTFYKWNGVIYNHDQLAPGGINIATKSSRYPQYKEFIDKVVKDLSGDQYKDGKWCFGKFGDVYTWKRIRISFPEILGISMYDESIESIITPGTLMIPVVPETDDGEPTEEI